MLLSLSPLLIIRCFRYAIAAASISLAAAAPSLRYYATFSPFCRYCFSPLLPLRHCRHVFRRYAIRQIIIFDIDAFRDIFAAIAAFMLFRQMLIFPLMAA